MGALLGLGQIAGALAQSATGNAGVNATGAAANEQVAGAGADSLRFEQTQNELNTAIQEAAKAISSEAKNAQAAIQGIV